MRSLLLIAFLACSLYGLAQDTEYTDARTARESFSHVSDKEIRADLSSFTIAGIAESINKPVLKRLPATSFGADFIRYDSNNLSITIRSAPFNSAKHKLLYDGKFLVKIDNKPYFGNYTKVPKVAISVVIVVSGKDTIPLPPAAWADLYDPHFTYEDGTGTVKSQDAVYVSIDKRKIYIYMLNRDENGSYEVTWIIRDNKYLRRVVDFGFTK